MNTYSFSHHIESFSSETYLNSSEEPIKKSISFLSFPIDPSVVPFSAPSKILLSEISLEPSEDT